MTAVMLIPSPLASARPDAIAITARMFPEAWDHAPLVANE
jgi:hypothetical protein